MGHVRLLIYVVVQMGYNLICANKEPWSLPHRHGCGGSEKQGMKPCPGDSYRRQIDGRRNSVISPNFLLSFRIGSGIRN